jgi:hypothetical protein
MELKIEIDGFQEGDIQVALEEVLKQVQLGYTSGSDANTTGRYSFEMFGSPVEYYCVEGDAERYFNFEEAQEAAKDADVVGYTSEDEEIVRITQKLNSLAE